MTVAVADVLAVVVKPAIAIRQDRAGGVISAHTKILHTETD